MQAKYCAQALKGEDGEVQTYRRLRFLCVPLAMHMGACQVLHRAIGELAAYTGVQASYMQPEEDVNAQVHATCERMVGRVHALTQA